MPKHPSPSDPTLIPTANNSHLTSKLVDGYGYGAMAMGLLGYSYGFGAITMAVPMAKTSKQGENPRLGLES